MKPSTRKKETEWVVSKAEAGLSLQDFLAEHLGVSKRVAKQHIDAKVVRVKGQTIWIARHPLKPGDAVSVATSVKSPTAVSKRVAKLSILYEDADYLVVDKPRGILVNAADYSLESIIRAQTGVATIVASHRLDRDTTGCLLMSKTPAAHDAIVDVFKRHRVAKTYRTVVYGRWDARSTTIELPIEGERALTHVHCLRANHDCSYLVVRIETGRTHQIRRHLAMARHPVVGDTQYGPKVIEDARLRSLTYPLLHAVEMELEHPIRGGSLKVFSPVPQDFHRWLAALKLESAR
jgi:RluA family pseudouridine synthase